MKRRRSIKRASLILTFCLLFIPRLWGVEYEWSGGAGDSSTTNCEWSDEGSKLVPRESRDVTNPKGIRTSGPLAVADDSSWVFYVGGDGKIRTTDKIEFSTGTEADETKGTLSHIETTSHSLKIVLDRENKDSGDGYKRFSIYSGDHATNPFAVFANDGDVVLMEAWDDAGTLLYSLYGDSSKAIFRRAVTGARTQLNTDGTIYEILPSTDGSDAWGVTDSAVSYVFRVKSDGTIIMVSDGKLTQGDTGSKPGNNHLGIGAADNYLSHASTSVTLGATRVYYTSDGGSTASACFRVPMPAKQYGGTVILDRLYVYYEAAGSGSGIDEIKLQSVDPNGTDIQDVVNHTTMLDDASEAAEHQWLDADCTMLTSPVGWRIRVDIKHLEAGTTYINGFYVEWHQE